MTIEEIKASGLLELYALGQLSAREHEMVRQYLATYPSLKKDLAEIEKALENFAQSASIQAPSAVKERILNEIGNTTAQVGPMKSATKTRNTGWRVAAGIAILVALGLVFLLMQKNRELKSSEARLAVVIDSCSNENQRNLADIENLQQLTRRDNEILHMSGTEKYPQTDIYFHHNPVTKRNFIQVRNLPALAANQSFQLWSLKPDTAPIPLDVFQQPTDQVIEVRYVDASQSYAITIESFGGQNSPTLADLIGIVNVGS